MADRPLRRQNQVFVEPSASAGEAKGKYFQAKEGSISNQGVRTVAVGESKRPTCPRCGEHTLRVRMNKPMGQRIYCENKSGCGYDTSKPNDGIKGTKTTVVSRQGAAQGSSMGVKIVSQNRR